MAAVWLTNGFAAFTLMGLSWMNIHFSPRTRSPPSFALALPIIAVSPLSAAPATGDDHFHKVKLRAEDDPNWDIFDIKVTDTKEDAPHAQEVADMRADMSPDEFAREMLNSFDAPVEGAFYTDALNALQSQDRVTQGSARSEHQRHHQLGSRDAALAGRLACSRSPAASCTGSTISRARGKPLSHYTDLLSLKAKAGGFSYRAHLLPHDVEVRELSTGYSRRHELSGLLKEPVITVPNHSTEDGITATRASLGVSWFDETACRRGLARLRAYRRGKSGMAIPDEAEDAADAFRTGCVGIPLITGGFLSKSGAGGRLRRRSRGC